MEMEKSLLENWIFDTEKQKIVSKYNIITDIVNILFRQYSTVAELVWN